GADQMMRLGRIGHLQYHEIRLAQQLIEAYQRSIELELGFFRDTLPVVVEHSHFETGSAARDRLSDAAHADDTQCCVMHVDTEPLLETPALPFAVTHAAFDLGDPARRAEHERPRKIRGAVVENTGRIRRDDTARSARRDVYIVIADRDVGDDL